MQNSEEKHPRAFMSDNVHIRKKLNGRGRFYSSGRSNFGAKSPGPSGSAFHLTENPSCSAVEKIQFLSSERFLFPWYWWNSQRIFRLCVRMETDRFPRKKKRSERMHFPRVLAQAEGSESLSVSSFIDKIFRRPRRVFPLSRCRDGRHFSLSLRPHWRRNPTLCSFR